MKKTIINCVLGICAAGLLLVCYKSIHDTEAFDAAVTALKAVLVNQGYKEQNGGFEKV